MRLLLAGASALAVSVGEGRAEPPAGEPIHEYVPLGDPPRSGGARGGAGAAEGPAGNRALEQPASAGLAQNEEPVYTPQPLDPVVAIGPPRPGDAPPERRDRVVPDRDTGAPPPGRHVYHEVFDPAVAPFKRMTALDAVLDDESLYVADGTRRAVIEEGLAARPGRDRFAGEVVVDLAPGRWVPLPSVAADSRLLAHRIAADAGERAAAPDERGPSLEFARDSADNLFVMARAASGRHRLAWWSDGAERYFGGELRAALRGVKLSDEPPGLASPLPPAIQRRAEVVADRIGVGRDTPLGDVLDALVAWFRGFEPGALPPQGPSTYLDIALGRKGACRHRAFAFTITALGLGLPTRYVENELHAFVEVHLPRVGWRRIDLGGVPLPHDDRGLEHKRRYVPKGPDGLPQPPAYRRDSANENANANATANRKAGDAPQQGRPATAPNAGEETIARLPRRPETSDGYGTQNADAPAPAPTSLTIALDAREAFRGDPLRVRGRLSVEHGDPAGARVAIELVGPGGRAVPLGETVTDGSGRFAADLEVPRDVALGEHRLIARFAGDERRAPSRSGP